MRFITKPDGRFEFGLARDHSAALSLSDDDLVFVNSPPIVHGHKGDRDLGDLPVERSATVSGVVQDGKSPGDFTPQAIARSYMAALAQPRGAWSWEIELRSHTEPF